MIQVCIMGMIFCFVFISFSTIQVFSGKLYGDNLGSDNNLLLYSVFAVGCFFAPAITTKLGCKMTMFLGICGYAAMVVSGLIFFEGADHDLKHTDDCCSGLQWVVLAGGALLGFGAAILWTAQGRLILEYTNDANRGFLFGVFWAFFQAAALVGGVLALVYFNQMGDDGDLTPLYFIFLSCIFIGGAGVFVLQEPEAIEDPLSPRTAAHVQSEAVNPWTDLVETCKMFFTYRCGCLAILFFYTGFNQPYQIVTFGRYFNKEAQAIEQIIFYSLEIFGGLLFGVVLDKAQPHQRRSRGLMSLVVLAVITLTGFGFAYFHEADHSDGNSTFYKPGKPFKPAEPVDPLIRASGYLLQLWHSGVFQTLWHRPTLIG